MAINNPNQIPLFPDLIQKIEQIEKTEKQINYSKSVISRLHAIRRTLPETEKPIISKLNKVLDDIRAIAKATTPAELEKMVLFAIEKNQAWTLADICDDLKLDRATVKPVLAEMEKKNLIRFVPRFIPGSYKPNYLIKSNRTNEPDAG